MRRRWTEESIFFEVHDEVLDAGGALSDPRRRTWTELPRINVFSC